MLKTTRISKNTASVKNLSACQISIQSPAKLNVGLRVLGRGADGYHQLQSVFWPVTFADEITLVRSLKNEVTARWHPDATLTVPLPQGRDNLAFSAVERFSSQSWSVTISKRIPLGGGLGGGSSNAGTVLRAIPLEYRADLSNVVTLGADVPFFLDPRPSWVEGIGEKCQALAFDSDFVTDLAFLMILPRVASETRRVFQRYRQSRPVFSPAGEKPSFNGKADFIRYLNTARNDLESIVCDELPDVRAILQEIRRIPSLYAGMSGSGSVCYCVFDSLTAANAAAKDLAAFCRQNNCKSVVTQTYAHH